MQHDDLEENLIPAQADDATEETADANAGTEADAIRDGSGEPDSYEAVGDLYEQASGAALFEKIDSDTSDETIEVSVGSDAYIEAFIKNGMLEDPAEADYPEGFEEDAEDNGEDEPPADSETEQAVEIFPENADGTDVPDDEVSVEETEDVEVGAVDAMDILDELAEIADAAENISRHVEESAAEEEAMSDMEEEPAAEEETLSDAEEEPAAEEDALSDAEEEPAAEEETLSDAEEEPAEEEALSDAEEEPAAEEEALSDAEEEPAAEEEALSDAEEESAAEEEALSDAEEEPAADEETWFEAEEEPTDEAAWNDVESIDDNDRAYSVQETLDALFASHEEPAAVPSSSEEKVDIMEYLNEAALTEIDRNCEDIETPSEPAEEDFDIGDTHVYEPVRLSGDGYVDEPYENDVPVSRRKKSGAFRGFAQIAVLLCVVAGLAWLLSTAAFSVMGRAGDPKKTSSEPYDNTSSGPIIQEFDDSVSDTASTTVPAFNTDKIALGDRSELVWSVQRRLSLLGYLSSSRVKGVYDRVTAEAVMQFQKANGLTASGEVDETTYLLLFDANAAAPTTVTTELPSTTTTETTTETTAEDTAATENTTTEATTASTTTATTTTTSATTTTTETEASAAETTPSATEETAADAPEPADSADGASGSASGRE